MKSRMVKHSTALTSGLCRCRCIVRCRRTDRAYRPWLWIRQQQRPEAFSWDSTIARIQHMYTKSPRDCLPEVHQPPGIHALHRSTVVQRISPPRLLRILTTELRRDATRKISVRHFLEGPTNIVTGPDGPPRWRPVRIDVTTIVAIHIHVS